MSEGTRSVTETPQFLSERPPAPIILINTFGGIRKDVLKRQKDRVRTGNEIGVTGGATKTLRGPRGRRLGNERDKEDGSYEGGVLRRTKYVNGTKTGNESTEESSRTD